MKQLAVLLAVLAYLTVRSFADPFWGIFMYYGLAVLRPQYLWEWALPKGVRWSLYAAIVAIITTFLKTQSLRPKKVRPIFIFLVTIFGVLIFASYVNAIDKEIAAKAGWEYTKIVIMVLVSSLVIDNLRQIRYLALMIFWCFAYVAYELNSLYVVNGYLYIYHRGFGGFDNNGAALLIAMMIPFGYFFFYAERRWLRWVYLLAIILAIHVVMISYSRGAMLSATVAGIGMLLTTFRRRPIHTALIAVVFTLATLALAGPAVRERYLSIGEKFSDNSAQLRLRSWIAGWRIAKDYPMLGVGIRNSNLIIHDYGADKEGRTIHNLYIQIAADSGIPAAIVYILMILFSFYWLLKAAYMCRDYLDEDEELRWHHYICLACFWSLAIFSFGSVFLSCEMVELCYLIMLMAAASPSVVQDRLGRCEPELVRRENNLHYPVGGVVFLPGR